MGLCICGVVLSVRVGLSTGGGWRRVARGGRTGSAGLTRADLRFVGVVAGLSGRGVAGEPQIGGSGRPHEMAHGRTGARHWLDRGAFRPAVCARPPTTRRAPPLAQLANCAVRLCPLAASPLAPQPSRVARGPRGRQGPARVPILNPSTCQILGFWTGFYPP
eukprot:6134723-Prymnesium_polylepis.1